MSKPEIEHVHETAISDEGKKDLDLIAEGAQHQELTAIEKRLLRKADWVIIPLGALAYFVAYLASKTRSFCVI